MTLRTPWMSFAGFGLYFALFLIPRIFPSVSATPVAFVLALSLIVVVPLLGLLAAWSTSALALSRLRKRPMDSRARAAGHTAFAGLSMLAASVVLGNLLPTPLPGGSYDTSFDRTVWLDPASTAYITGGATPRQKMLADVIAQLPHKNRSELEAMLGPSLDIPYFKSSGRDLIYFTGPERDSFFRIDSEWLLIWLDQEGIYKSYAIATD